MEEKKERTIEKAREYFHKYWYRKASLSDLIAEIGISKPTFYNYFKNKEQLFASVMLSTYNEFQYEFTQRSKTASSAVERLEIFVHTYAWFLENYPLFKDLYIPGNDLLPRWIKSRSSKDLFAEGVETVKGIIIQGQEEGIFDPQLNSEAASLILYNNPPHTRSIWTHCCVYWAPGWALPGATTANKRLPGARPAPLCPGTARPRLGLTLDKGIRHRSDEKQHREQYSPEEIGLQVEVGNGPAQEGDRDQKDQEQHSNHSVPLLKAQKKDGHEQELGHVQNRQEE